MTRASHQPVLLGMTVLGVIVIPPLFATGQSWELVPLAAIASLTVLFWRPIQVWARSLERDELAAHNPDTGQQQITMLRQELQALTNEQHRLHEVLAWQEQLLWRAVGEPDVRSQSPVDSHTRIKTPSHNDLPASIHESAEMSQGSQGERGVTTF